MHVNKYIMCLIADGYVDTSFPFHAMVGPDWTCMLVTYCLIIGGGYATIIGFVSKFEWASVLVPLQWSLVGATVLCYTFAGCSEPGIIFKELFDDPVELEATADERDLEDNSKRRMPKRSKCMHCEVYRLPSASHCYDCDLCIEDLDHHCPWTGKCIGGKNLKYFYAFLTSLTVLIFCSVGFLIVYMTGFGIASPEGGGGDPTFNVTRY